MMATRAYDVLCIGRSSIDLYSNDVGSPFTEITNFAAYVGGCPTNIAVGTRRLGLKSALLTGIGQDPVGQFIRKFLDDEGVVTEFVAVKPERRTSAVVLGIEPPDRFPLVYYRENCADIGIDVDDVEKIPFEKFAAVLVSGTGLSKDPSRTATIRAMELARAAGCTIFLDLDFRADQWLSSGLDARAYGITVRSLLHMVDIAFGTEEEIKAAMLSSKDQVAISSSQVSAPTVTGNTEACIDALLTKGPKALVVKNGAQGATVHLPDGTEHHADAFKVEVSNVLGAGDAFASGFIYGYLKNWDWTTCARMGNATGAIVVTKHGCANFMPTEREALDFAKANGGLSKEDLTCHR